MNLEINGNEWKIVEVNEKDEKLKINDKECWGTCMYEEQTIYICQEMRLSKKKQTLMHELSHAFLYEYLLKFQENFDNEELCEFVAKYSQRIGNLANKYIDYKYKYTKGC